MTPLRRCDPSRGVSALEISGTVLTVHVTTATLGYAYTTSVRARENITFDLDLISRSGFERLRNIRLSASNGNTACYTVRHAYQTGSTFDVVMHLSGATKLGYTGSQDVFTVTADPVIVNNGISDANAQSSGAMYESVFDDGSSKIVIIAPHGGGIEQYTDGQAETMRTRLSGAAGLSGSVPVVWHCRGYANNGQNVSDRWHVTSTNTSTASFPLLNGIYGRGFTYGLSFHGQSGTAQVDVGGAANAAFLNQIVSVISSTLSGAATVSVTGNASLEGAQSDNILNRLVFPSTSSVQVEQTFDVRQNYGTDIAIALADFYRANVFR